MPERIATSPNVDAKASCISGLLPKSAKTEAENIRELLYGEGTSTPNGMILATARTSRFKIEVKQ